MAAPPAAGEVPAAASPAAAKGKGLPEWVELQTRLQTTQGKIGVAKSNLEKLMAEKRLLKGNSPRTKVLIQDLVVAHKEYRRLVDSYRQQELMFKFRFPERGLKESESFDLPEVKSLSEMEEEMGLDAELTKTIQLVRLQYGSSRQPASLPESKAVGTEPEDAASSAKKNPVLESPAFQFRR